MAAPLSWIIHLYLSFILVGWLWTVAFYLWFHLPTSKVSGYFAQSDSSWWPLQRSFAGSWKRICALPVRHAPVLVSWASTHVLGTLRLTTSPSLSMDRRCCKTPSWSWTVGDGNYVHRLSWRVLWTATVPRGAGLFNYGGCHDTCHGWHILPFSVPLDQSCWSWDWLMICTACG